MVKYCNVLCFVLCLCFGCVFMNQSDDEHKWDDKGYLIFCLCMGRFGNQADHFIGGLAFAKNVDRTLVIPPFRTYKNVPFTDWFRLDGLSKYHRVILAEDFMATLAQEHWPPGNRTGYCYGYGDRQCEMKKGNPFGPFWDDLGVDFDQEITYSVSYTDLQNWKESFPPSKHPVIALKGAPARYPALKEHWPLQQYLQWSADIIEQGQKYIEDNFPGQQFLGIHLRNGIDWERACEHAEGQPSYMSSPQCIDHGSGRNVTKDLCFPSTSVVLGLVKDVVTKTGINVIYVATDQNPLIKELTDGLKEFKVTVYHQDPWLPQLDLYILGQSDHFVGNCVSSFTGFVTRERLVNNKPTYFWGYS